MDEYAARSHQRVLAAQRAGHSAGELVPVFDKAGKLYPADDGVREDSTAENLAKLRPFFDRKYGNVTAGNSSQITDGGAWLISLRKGRGRTKLTPIGRIVDTQGRASIQRRWAWAPCMRRRRSCSGTTWR